MNITKLADYSQPLVAAATVLGLSLLVSVSVGAYTAYQVKVAGDTIQVTGSAKEAVVADFGRWTMNLETKTGVFDQQAGLDRLERATDDIVAHLKKLGFTEIETPSANISTTYIYPERAEPVHTGYSVSRQITLRSADIEALSELSNNIAPLTGSGYQLTTGALELTYQKLPDMRVKLLTQAIEDARARAEAIAKETGRSVGVLRSATGGVVQVLPQDGVDISDYGSYDTQSKNKDVMVTVRATFSIE